MNPIRVVKIGGSLLRRDNLLADLQHWQDSLTKPLINVWIVGGGAAVDAIRKRDLHHGLSDDEAHWLSIAAMDTNAKIFSSQMPDWQLTANYNVPVKAATAKVSGISQATGISSHNFILQTKDWLIQAQQSPNSPPQLPHSWDVTSDSIAAWAAIQLYATELVLLKSCDVPPKNVADLAVLGIVDPYLPSLNLERQSFHFTCQQLPHSVS